MATRLRRTASSACLPGSLGPNDPGYDPLRRRLHRDRAPTAATSATWCTVDANRDGVVDFTVTRARDAFVAHQSAQRPALRQRAGRALAQPADGVRDGRRQSEGPVRARRSRSSTSSIPYGLGVINNPNSPYIGQVRPGVDPSRGQRRRRPSPAASTSRSSARTSAASSAASACGATRCARARNGLRPSRLRLAFGRRAGARLQQAQRARLRLRLRRGAHQEQLGRRGDLGQQADLRRQRRVRRHLGRRHLQPHGLGRPPDLHQLPEPGPHLLLQHASGSSSTSPTTARTTTRTARSTCSRPSPSSPATTRIG